MRGVAAVVVLVWHARALFGYAPASGYLAVDLFFALSGFVIAHAYDGRFDKGLTTPAFMRLRMIRFYPLYGLGVAIMAAGLVGAMLLHAHTNWTPGRLSTALAFNLAFVPVLPSLAVDGNLYPLDPPAWSLGLEILVNIAFAVSWRAFAGTRALFIIVALSLAMLVATANGYGSLNVGVDWHGFAGSLARVSYSFFVGVLIMRLKRAQGPVPMQSHPVALVVVIIALVAVLSVPVAGAWRVPFDLVAVSVGFPCLILMASTVEPHRRLAPAFERFGSASYAIYALHVPLLALASGVLARLAYKGGDSSGTMVGLAFAVFVVMFAIVADRFYDLPVRRHLVEAVLSLGRKYRKLRNQRQGG